MFAKASFPQIGLWEHCSLVEDHQTGNIGIAGNTDGNEMVAEEKDAQLRLAVEKPRHMEH